MKICPKCKRVNDNKAQVCHNCGQKLTGSYISSFLKERNNYIALIVISIFSFVLLILGFFLYPFISYVTGVPIALFPIVATIIFSLLFIVLRQKFQITEKAIFLILFFGVLNLLVIGYRYSGGQFYGNRTVITGFSGGEGLANPLGITVLSPEYEWVLFDHAIPNKDLALLYENGKYAFYSIGLDEIVMPLGQSLLTYGEIFEENGLYGIATKHGYIVVGARYNKIEKRKDHFYVEYGGEHESLTGYWTHYYGPEH